MNRNFFIRLTFAAHRVADAISDQQTAQNIRESANQTLTYILFLIDKEALKPEKKQELFLKLTAALDSLLRSFDVAKKQRQLKVENFVLLEEEYGKIREFLEVFSVVEQSSNEGVEISELSASSQPTPKPSVVSFVPRVVTKDIDEKAGRTEKELSARQKKIIEFLKVKENAQVWELQKILPEVTKRTLRRDLDELLQKNLVERKGAWNSVSYELKS